MEFKVRFNFNAEKFRPYLDFLYTSPECKIDLQPASLPPPPK